eukprot:Opistho-1_new@98712
MGILDRFLDFFGFRKRKVNILCVGLDNSGKSTIINKLKPDKSQVTDVVPTVGFNVEVVEYGGLLQLTVFDMSGQGRYRTLWEHYYSDCEAIIFVVDSTDRFRSVVVKDELTQLLSHKDIKKRRIPILFYANKLDLPGSLSHVEWSNLLELDRIKDKPWHITASNAISGQGLQEGIQWLADKIRSDKS